MIHKLGAFLISVLTLAFTANALSPLTVKNNYFVNSSGDPFVLVGVDYQPGGSSGYSNSASSDVLSDEDVCLRDAFVLQQLGVNTIRVYTISPWINHDACMSIFNAVGIYVILDVNSPLAGESIYRDDPADSYNEGYLNRIFGVVDAFKGYQNTLGFFAGNEVINDETSASVSPPYIRAVQRDLKQYIALHANRTIPVGYSAADDTELRLAGFEYLQCGGTDVLDESRSDFYGLNSYQWCSGVNNFQTSGYGILETSFAKSAIPLFFSEYGCNTKRPRTFDEVTQGVYTESFLQVFGGGLVYEYSEEDNNYGLVTVKSDESVQYKVDFDNLKTAYLSLNYTSFVTSSFIDNVSVPECSKTSIQSIDSRFNASLTLPECPAPDLLKNGGGNNNVGKWIPLNSTQTTYKVYDSNGDEIEDTAITVVSDQSIYQSGNQQSSSSSSSSSATASATAATSSGTDLASATTTAASSSTSKSAGSFDGPASVLSLFVCAFLSTIIVA
ncbi:Glucanosyltransferase-domain-containing protein [Lipomyces japonicus]|uniref:Glucanosyltransferase-domain-containing protein n=1 Tax=Lipomyces japonicus TaxID=56871 RepID=UPI0034CDCFCD